LTWILRESLAGVSVAIAILLLLLPRLSDDRLLTGNARTTMLAALSPASINAQETLSTLR
jgi:hypothetical protein